MALLLETPITEVSSKKDRRDRSGSGLRIGAPSRRAGNAAVTGP